MVLALVERQEQAHSCRAEVLGLVDDDPVVPRAGAALGKFERLEADVRPVVSLALDQCRSVLGERCEYPLAISAAEAASAATTTQCKIIIERLDASAGDEGIELVEQELGIV